MANYLVTGGAGFIGSNLVEYLVEHGEAVRVLDNFLTGKRENLAPWLSRIELIEGDLRDPDICARATEDMDFVLHEGALASVPLSVAEPVRTSEINIIGTVQLLHACVKSKVKRLVYAASSSAYGENPEPSKHEGLLPAPLSPYAAAKLSGEYFCQAFASSYGLETVGIRYFNVFGPRQDPGSQYSAVIPLFITAMLAGKSPVIYGDGLQSRDFTYIANIVEGNILAARAPREASGRVINVACGRSYSLLDLIEAINKALGTKIQPRFEPARVGDVKYSLADISLARQLLGYDVKVNFDEGLRRTVEWYRSRHR